jgi:hypothetical protein
LDIEELLIKSRQILKGSSDYAWTSVPAYPRQVNMHIEINYTSQL